MEKITLILKKKVIDEFYKSLILLTLISALLGFLIGLGVASGLNNEDCECNQSNASTIEQGIVTSNISNTIQTDVQNTEADSETIISTDKPSSSKICVEVAGAVTKPGLYCFTNSPVYVGDLIKRAGGFSLSSYASSFVAQRVNLATRLQDSQRVYIPYIQEVKCEPYQFGYSVESKNDNTLQTVWWNSDALVGTNPGNTDDDLSTDVTVGDGHDNGTNCININTASSTELEELDGVGPATAKLIVENRPYSSTEDLMLVSGIGEKKYAAMLPDICPIP